MCAVYAYARISTKGTHQKLDRQLYELKSRVKGLRDENIFTDEISGLTKSRESLDKLKAKLQKGDILYVESLSRLSRSAKDLLEQLEQFNKLGIEFHSLKEDFTYNSAWGKLILGVMAAIVQFERDLIAERVKEGIDATRAKGTRLGRKPVDKEKIRQAIEMYNNPARTSSVANVLKTVGISKSTFYRELNKIKDKERIGNEV